MPKHRISAATLLGLGMALGYLPPSALSQSAPVPPQAAVKEIHVDGTCRILLEQSDALAGLTEAELQNDHAICNVGAPHITRHVEEALRDGVMQSSRVTVAEQTYFLQNVTADPIAFVVEHALADGWTVDSDPQPVKVAENKAFFRVYAAPGQIVQMHEGQRHTEAGGDTDSQVHATQ